MGVVNPPLLKASLTATPKACETPVSLNIAIIWSVLTLLGAFILIFKVCVKSTLELVEVDVGVDVLFEPVSLDKTSLPLVKAANVSSGNN